MNKLFLAFLIFALAVVYAQPTKEEQVCNINKDMYLNMANLTVRVANGEGISKIYLSCNHIW